MLAAHRVRRVTWPHLSPWHREAGREALARTRCKLVLRQTPPVLVFFARLSCHSFASSFCTLTAAGRAWAPQLIDRLLFSPPLHALSLYANHGRPPAQRQSPQRADAPVTLEWGVRMHFLGVCAVRLRPVVPAASPARVLRSAPVYREAVPKRSTFGLMSAAWSGCEVRFRGLLSLL